MTGREYIEGNYIKELGYLEAEESVKNQVIERLKANGDRYTYGWFIDEPIYPANADLYDEFCDEVNGEIDIYEEDLIGWAVRVINHTSTEYRIDTGWEDDCDSEVLYLRSLTEDEKAEMGI